MSGSVGIDRRLHLMLLVRVMAPDVIIAQNRLQYQLESTLQDDDITVWESEAVLGYLGSWYGEQFFPVDIANGLF